MANKLSLIAVILPFAFVSLFASKALAQLENNPGVQQPERARIEGRTLDRISGGPLRKTTVYLQPLDRPGSAVAAISDGDGYFVFENVSTGRYQLSGERQGFVRQQYGARSSSLSGQPVSVSAPVTKLVFQLFP